MRRSVAVIGGGAAGLSAAYHLQATCDVTLFEREPCFGGHARTLEVADGPDAGLPLDVAFMVMNSQSYPEFFGLLQSLGGIALGPSEMSFSYCCRASGEEYAINHDHVLGANAPRRATAPPAILLSLYSEISRFCGTATQDAEGGDLDGQDLGQYLEEKRFSERLRRRYIIPMGAALWSTPPGKVLSFPAALFLRFMKNHGMLNLRGGGSWQHILGGSGAYVRAMVQTLGTAGARLRPSTAVRRVARQHQKVIVETDAGAKPFDAVVMATHANHALRLLADPGSEEAELLGSFKYQHNDAVLHCDESVMPRCRESWASWNYEQETGDEAEGVCITYHLNRLQGHHNTNRQYFLTLNRRAMVEQETVLARLRFTHPLFDAAALRAQRSLARRGMRNQTCFAGSYLGYGFHEDAIVSGRLAANSVTRI
jgi:predicted NAD/FAD-binding protein